jgi:hypothetical protein
VTIATWLVPLFYFPILVLAQFIAPFDFEKYIQFHFTKVGDQTKLFIDEYIRLGSEYGVAVDAITALTKANRRWTAAPPGVSASTSRSNDGKSR